MRRRGGALIAVSAMHSRTPQQRSKITVGTDTPTPTTTNEAISALITDAPFSAFLVLALECLGMQVETEPRAMMRMRASPKGASCSINIAKIFLLPCLTSSRCRRVIGVWLTHMAAMAAYPRWIPTVMQSMAAFAAGSCEVTKISHLTGGELMGQSKRAVCFSAFSCHQRA